MSAYQASSSTVRLVSKVTIKINLPRLHAPQYTSKIYFNDNNGLLSNVTSKLLSVPQTISKEQDGKIGHGNASANAVIDCERKWKYLVTTTEK